MKIKIILIVGLILCFCLFIVGNYIPHYLAPADKFIGQIGNTYFYNFTDKKITQKDIKEFWYFHNAGLPGPFSAFVRFRTRRVDIVDINVKYNEGNIFCPDGFFTTDEYSFFNIQTRNNLKIHVSCA